VGPTSPDRVPTRGMFACQRKSNASFIRPAQPVPNISRLNHFLPLMQIFLILIFFLIIVYGIKIIYRKNKNMIGCKNKNKDIKINLFFRQF
jgi:hypothetical protein